MYAACEGNGICAQLQRLGRGEVERDVAQKLVDDHIVLVFRQ
jgi:hypothetical protein